MLYWRSPCWPSTEHCVFSRLAETESNWGGPGAILYFQDNFQNPYNAEYRVQRLKVYLQPTPAGSPDLLNTNDYATACRLFAE